MNRTTYSTTRHTEVIRNREALAVPTRIKTKPKAVKPEATLAIIGNGSGDLTPVLVHGTMPLVLARHLKIFVDMYANGALIFED